MDGAVSASPVDERLGTRLVLDELFDLSLYTALHARAAPDVRKTLDELIRIERTHLEFWQEFFKVKRSRLDRWRRVKLALLTFACRLLGTPAIHLVLDAIEVYGVRKYLSLWEYYENQPLGEAVRGVLEDELKHEDQIVTALRERKINPERIRNIFLGLNDGLVEILGAVSGFYGAFGNPVMVLLAAVTTAVAGALSMSAGAYVATSSEREVTRTELGKRRFLGERQASEGRTDPPLTAALLVGISYFAGALVPVLPVLAGARSALPSVVTAGGIMLIVSLVLAFLSGMAVARRVVTNVVIIAVAVGVTYAIGRIASAVWGIPL